MVELPVELVADPLGHLRTGEQLGGAADLVVEVDQPLALLGLVPGMGEGARQPQRGHQTRGQGQQAAQVADDDHAGENRSASLFEMLLELEDILAVAHLFVRSEQQLEQVIEARQSLVRLAAEPFADGSD